MLSKVVVITLNYNQEEYTTACLESLLKSDYTDYKILLVDNGSEEKSYENLKSKFVENDTVIIERISQNVGYVGGINYGLTKAQDFSPEYFIIMNNDTVVCKKMISNLVKSSKRNSDNALITGKVYHYDQPEYLQDIGQYLRNPKKLDYPPVIGNYFELDEGQYDEEVERGMIDDIVWIIPSKIQRSIGLYSDMFFLYGEQNDYALRAIKKGFKLIYCPDVKIWHKGGVTTSNSNKNTPRIVYWTTIGTLKLSELHLKRREAILFQITWVLKNLVKKVITLLTDDSNPKMVGAFLKATLEFLRWKKTKYVDDGYNPY